MSGLSGIREEGYMARLVCFCAEPGSLSSSQVNPAKREEAHTLF